MKILKQICIILLFYIIGEMVSYGVSWLFPAFFVPGTIVGMALLLLVLLMKWLKLEEVDEVGTFLSNNMGFFFVPVAVSVIDYLELLQSVIVRVLVICFISIVVSFFLVAYSVKMTVLFLEKRKKKEEVL